MKKKDQNRTAGSFFLNTDLHKKTLCAALLLTALFLASGFGAVRASAGTKAKTAGTATAGTTVIRTQSEEEFAEEVSRLAKKNPGLSVQSTGKLRPYSSARLIVRVKDGRTVDFSRYRAQTVVESDYGISIVQFASASAAKKAAASLNSLSSVVYTEPDDCGLDTGDMEILEMESGQGTAAESPDSTSCSGSKTVGNIPSGEDLTYYTSLKASSLSTASTSMSWGVSYIQADKYASYVKSNTKRSIKVAVVDSGVSSHTKLKGRLLAGKDFVDNDNNPTDKNGHGTHVAGTIVDCTPGLNVYILPVRVMNASGLGNPSVTGNGIRYAVRKGAKVINLSLGGDSHYKYLEECIEYAYKKGVSVIVAAGNFCEDTRYTCPAHLSTPIVVGSINKKGSRSWFSNFGKSVDVVAPGENILSCWKDGSYVTASGTSMAAPHVAAVTAMYRLMNPSYSVTKIHRLVKSYTKDLGAKGTDRYYGRGVPRMSAGIAPSRVSLSKTSASLTVRGTLTLKAKLYPAYAGRKALSWSSSNSSVVAVSKTGKMTAKKKGTATITVKTVNGKKATCKVTVTNTKLSQAVSTQQVSAQQVPNTGINTLPKSSSQTGARTLSAETSSGTQTLSTEASSGAQTLSTEVSSGAQTVPAGASSNGAASDAEFSDGRKTLTTEASSGTQMQSAEAFLDAQDLPETGPLPEKETENTPGAQDVAEISSSPDAQPAAGSFSGADSRAAEAAASQTAQDNRKIYVFPSERTDNAHIRDGSIVTGERLALDYEIVPAEKSDSDPAPAPVWKSSDPAVASVDENGIVTALSPGEIELTALPAAEDTQPADPGSAREASETGSSVICKPLHLTVVAPSVLTRDVSYSAGEEETEVRMEAVLRLPGGLPGGSGSAKEADISEEDDSDGSAGGEDSPLNPAAGYVLAMLREGDGQEPVLLGAVDLNAGPGTRVHVHDPETGKQISDTAALPGDLTVLSSVTEGKQPAQTGLLRLNEITEESGKAYVSLLLDAGPAKAALQKAGGSYGAAKDRLEEQTLCRADWKCSLAVYESPDFEARETAAEKGDTALVRELDRKALCTCAFSLKMEYTAPADPASGPANAETVPAPGKEPSEDAAPENDRSKENGSENDGSKNERSGNDGSGKDAPEDKGGSEDKDGSEKEGAAEEKTGADGTGKDDSGQQTSEEGKHPAEAADPGAKEDGAGEPSGEVRSETTDEGTDAPERETGISGKQDDSRNEGAGTPGEENETADTGSDTSGENTDLRKEGARASGEETRARKEETDTRKEETETLEEGTDALKDTGDTLQEVTDASGKKADASKEEHGDPDPGAPQGETGSSGTKSGLLTEAAQEETAESPSAAGAPEDVTEQPQ